MKSRNGFVSNSSTSSFTCCVCGETVAERDLWIRDAGMFECEGGHCTHDDCVPKDMKDEALKDLISDDPHAVPIKYCPLCMFKVIDNSAGYQYLLRRIGISESLLLRELATTYPDYKSFLEDLKKPRKLAE